MAEYAQEFGGKVSIRPTALSFDVVLVAAGLGLSVLGSRWLLQGAVAIASRLGVSELVIGLTIVAAGTSLPELATSVVASFRGERDIAVGNVIGSNLFNLMAVLGVAGIVAPNGVSAPPASLRIDFPVMLVAAMACLPVFLSGRHISRLEGMLFFAGYIAYTTYLVTAATKA